MSKQKLEKIVYLKWANSEKNNKDEEDNFWA